MSDNISTVQNASLGAGVTTGLMPVITQNATAISVICTVIFGLIYASCAIWNAYSNHRRNTVNRRKIVEEILSEMEEGEVPHDVISQVRKSVRH